MTGIMMTLLGFGGNAGYQPSFTGNLSYFGVGPGGSGSTNNNGGGGEGGQVQEGTMSFTQQTFPITFSRSIYLNEGMYNIGDNAPYVFQIGNSSYGSLVGASGSTNGGNGGNGSNTNTGTAGGPGVATSFFDDLPAGTTFLTLPITLGVFAGGGGGGRLTGTTPNLSADLSGMNGAANYGAIAPGQTRRGTYGTGGGGGTPIYGTGPSMMAIRTDKNLFNFHGGIKKTGTLYDYFCVSDLSNSSTYIGNNQPAWYHGMGESTELVPHDWIFAVNLDAPMEGYGTTATIPVCNEQNVTVVLFMSVHTNTNLTLNATTGWTKQADLFVNGMYSTNLGIFTKFFPNGIPIAETITLSNAALWSIEIIANSTGTVSPVISATSVGSTNGGIDTWQLFTPNKRSVYLGTEAASRINRTSYFPNTNYGDVMGCFSMSESTPGNVLSTGVISDYMIQHSSISFKGSGEVMSEVSRIIAALAIS